MTSHAKLGWAVGLVTTGLVAQGVVIGILVHRLQDRQPAPPATTLDLSGYRHHVSQLCGVDEPSIFRSELAGTVAYFTYATHDHVQHTATEVVTGTGAGEVTCG